jgi:1,6-anhydro-N-acetylmuramate kinase
MGGEGWIGLMSGTSLDGVDAVLAVADAWRSTAAAPTNCTVPPWPATR